jgi:hypothetical protein
MCLSMEDTKTLTEILRNIAEITALIIGGIWTYQRFIKKREPYPKAEIRHGISHVRLSKDKNLVHVITTFHNKGEVLLSMINFDTRLQQITPLTKEMEDKVKAVVDSVPEDETEVEWPLLGCREKKWPKAQAELEPGESEHLHADFIIDSSIQVVVAYSYIKNIYKGKQEIGWGCTTIYDIQKGALVRGREK